ncbi:MAG: hypothetical protein EXR99_04615 [Gemmataceae bacterium]|nr:hypothetical protein [Gemmataceae bacterium]
MSQRFTVKGADKASGKPIECVIVAEDGEKASKIAQDRGIVVSSVTLFGEAPKAVAQPTPGVILAPFNGFGHIAGKVEMSTALQETGGFTNILWAMVAGVVSAAMHGLLILLIMLIPFENAAVQATKLDEPTKIEESEPEPDLTMTDIGNDIEVPTQYNVDRKDENSVPGPDDPTQAVGIPNSPETVAANVPPPPGFGGGTGGAPALDVTGLGSNIGSLGGMGGVFAPGGVGGRSGATREKLLREGGGNALSEACVARGLKWLALHQAEDGHWGMHNYGDYYRSAPIGTPNSKLIKYRTQDKAQNNDIAGTGFGLLPFLAAGITHRPTAKKTQENYSKTVLGGVNYLIKKQGKNGDYGGGLYSHPLVTIAMCEAYGMTSDPMIKASAQKALDYLIYAQHDGGGWRYGPKQAGDTSVTGWCVMALKSGQMAGLKVPTDRFKLVESYLDSCFNDKDGGYGYTGKGTTPTMTAVGMLCRQYMGVNPRNTGLLKGVEILKKQHPGANKNLFNLYLLYYATQVMHHMGGESWDYWNLGPEDKGMRKNGLRDILIERQTKSNDPKKVMLAGSWDPEVGGHGDAGGRMMATSLSMLNLEVYYRHLPLYRREMGGNK